MSSVRYRIPNISCGHCIHTIQMELSEMAGIGRVEVSLEGKTVRIDFAEPATEDQIVALLRKINYPPEA